MSSINKEAIENVLRKELVQLEKNKDEFEERIKVLKEILNIENIFAWGSSHTISSISRGDTLYLANGDNGDFKFRANVIVTIESTELASVIWKNERDRYIYFVENVQRIDMDREEHLFFLGLSKKSDIRQNVYIRDRFQEIEALKKEKELQNVFGNNLKDYIKALEVLGLKHV